MLQKIFVQQLAAKNEGQYDNEILAHGPWTYRTASRAVNYPAPVAPPHATAGRRSRNATDRHRDPAPDRRAASDTSTAGLHNARTSSSRTPPFAAVPCAARSAGSLNEPRSGSALPPDRTRLRRS